MEAATAARDEVLRRLMAPDLHLVVAFVFCLVLGTTPDGEGDAALASYAAQQAVLLAGLSSCVAPGVAAAHTEVAARLPQLFSVEDLTAMLELMEFRTAQGALLDHPLLLTMLARTLAAHPEGWAPSWWPKFLSVLWSFGAQHALCRQMPRLYVCGDTYVIVQKLFYATLAVTVVGLSISVACFAYAFPDVFADTTIKVLAALLVHLCVQGCCFRFYESRNEAALDVMKRVHPDLELWGQAWWSAVHLANLGTDHLPHARRLKDNTAAVRAEVAAAAATAAAMAAAAVMVAAEAAVLAGLGLVPA